MEKTRHLDEEEFNNEGFGHEVELEDSDPEDEEVHGSTPLITACRKSRTEVIQKLMKSEVDVTLCDPRQQTALHVGPPELQGKVLGWMSRPHLPPQAQLLQAAWQGDLHSLQSLLVQTDKVDVNVPNRDGATAVMLAVRDIDLFEGMALPLPWEHKPVQVVEKLLGLSADLRVRDHGGCSALNYATSINSPLKDEIIHMMAEALSRSDAATDNYPCRDLDSEFEDSDIDLDLESIYSQRSAAATPTQTPTNQDGSTLHIHTEEVPDSPGCPPPSDHHKSLSQDKGIPLCFENAMETLSDIRQAYQDAGRGSRGGVSLPSLGLNSRRWTLDPDHSSGLQSTRTSCLPVPPRHRQRTRSVAAASSSSPGRTFVAEPSELSQSAPSIMEPLLSSNTMMQARAHIQSRLGAQDTATEQKQFPQRPLPTPHPRTPRLLAPLDSRLRDIIPLPGLKHPIPLKPISRSPLCSRARPKRGGLSRGSSRLGPLTTKGGSEDSGSSSSQSSMDLEDEDEGVSGGVHLKFVGDLLLQTSNNVSSSVTDSVSNTTGCSKVPPRTRHFSQIHRSAHDLNEEPFNHSDDPFRTVTYTTYHCEDKVNQISDTKDHVDSNTFTKQQGNTLNLTQVTISNEMPITSKPQEERTSAGYTPDPQTEVSNRTSVNKDQSGVERSSRNDQTKQTEKTSKDCFYGKSLGDDPDQKLDLMTADNRNVDTSGDTKLSKVLKSVQNKERKATKNCEAEAEIQTNPESFSRPPNKDRISSNRIKIKENLKTLSTQVEVKMRKSHELKINGETVTKVKSKLKCVKGTATPSPRKKVTDPAHSRRATPDRSNINKDQQHLPKTEPKSARQLKRPSLEGSSRSRSVLDFITYKDMFQQIQSGDKGPAIYEMFAGPIYENLRVSSSCEKVKDRQVRSAPPRKTHKVKQRPMKQAQSNQRRSLADSTEDSPKSKAKLSTPRAKPQVTSVPRRGTEKIKQIVDGHSETELHALTEAGSCPNSSEEAAGDQMLPTIEEDLSRYESEILKSDNKTLTGPATLSHSGYSYPQEKDGNSSTGRQNLPMSESSQSPQHPKINTWTSSSSNNHTIMSPVYQRFLDGVGDGPLTDDLLQCLAEELISLDERDVSTGPDPSERECDGESNLLMVNKTENVDLLGSGLIVDDNISWTKGEVLGRGAYGTVYCGLTSRGELIAVKQVSLDASDPDAAKREYNRLQGEVDLLKTLRHNNIVGFLGTSLHQHVVSIFMEYIPGGSIASILHRFGPLPERVLALYTHQILEGVTFLHLNRVIHRDLKGNNVMLMPTGVIKLIDFGCARRLSCLNHTASNSGDLLKSVHGTPYWMAPEVINETGYGRKSDVWSVGCTVFEMATGKPPLAHMDKMAALFYIGAQRGKMPSLPDGFSQSAKDFVKICLTSNQRQRPSAEKLLTHPFIPQNETGANSWETQRRNRCGHLEGLCG